MFFYSEFNVRMPIIKKKKLNESRSLSKAARMSSTYLFRFVKIKIIFI